MSAAAAAVASFEEYFHLIPTGYTVHGRIDGIIQKLGKSAGQEANWCLEAKDERGHECLLMYCNPGIFTIIDCGIIDELHTINGKPTTWYLSKVGYIACSTVIDGVKTVLYLHQYLMNYRGHGRGQDSIDHLNRNKLDNRISNLEIKTQSEQNQNTGKRCRKYNAKDLPEGIKQEDLPKYIVYYKECTNKETGRWRKFFRVEKHPIQKLKLTDSSFKDSKNAVIEKWATSKSVKVSIEEKLEEAKEYIKLLDSYL